MYRRQKQLLLTIMTLLAFLMVAETGHAGTILASMDAPPLAGVNAVEIGCFLPLSGGDRNPSDPVDYDSLNTTLPAGGSSSGASSASGFGSDGGVISVHSAAAIRNQASVSWLVPQWSFAVADPPESGLLRPPQGCCNIGV